MRRSTAATLALACMGTSVGVAALVGPPVSADAPASERAAAVAAVRADVATAREARQPRQTGMAAKSAAGKYQRKAFNATNARRDDHGLKSLRRAKCVQRFAVKQARAMAKRNEMYHQELGPIMKACGLNLVGENVAYGYPTGRSVVNDGWMRSEGHRANILNPDYRLMGIGARKGGDGRWYVSQVFGRRP